MRPASGSGSRRAVRRRRRRGAASRRRTRPRGHRRPAEPDPRQAGARAPSSSATTRPPAAASHDEEPWRRTATGTSGTTATPSVWGKPRSKRRTPPSARVRRGARGRPGRGRAGFRRAPAPALPEHPRQRRARRPRRSRADPEGRRPTRGGVETERGQKDQQPDQKRPAGRSDLGQLETTAPRGAWKATAVQHAFAGVGDSVILCLRPRRGFRRRRCFLRFRAVRARRETRLRARARLRSARARGGEPRPSARARPPWWRRLRSR